MLKQLIQRLLDSRTTPSEASHSSYPDDGTVTQFSPSATSVSSWTKVVDSTIAPSDGYVIVRGKATGESYVQITAGDNPPHMERSTFAKATLNQYPILNLPIAKGKTFKVFAENTAEITVGLIKSIGGGGYKHFVRRALSCLKPSFNFLLRSFSRVNGKQSKLGIFQKSETRLHSHQRQGKTLFTRLQRTDTFKSSCETARRVKNSPSLCTQEEMKTAVQGRNSKILMDGFLYIYPFSRVKLSRFSAQELSQTLSLRSIRTTNPQTGGALC